MLSLFLSGVKLLLLFTSELAHFPGLPLSQHCGDLKQAGEQN